MSLPEIIEEALHLKPQERYLIVENLLLSLNTPDAHIDAIWKEESQKRLKAYQNGEIKSLTFEQVFDK